MAALKAGRWQVGVGHDLRGKTLGIYGYGQDRQRGRGLRQGFRDEVLVWGARARSTRRAATDTPRRAARRQFFSQCDVLSLHMRLVEATRGIVTAETLRA